VNDIIRANIISILIPLLKTNNDDLRMRICWVVNNLCVHGAFIVSFHSLHSLCNLISLSFSHPESGRDAVNNSNIVNEFPDLLGKPRHTETIQKISWGLTNLARLRMTVVVVVLRVSLWRESFVSFFSFVVLFYCVLRI
jgi:hypothetical protein